MNNNFEEIIKNSIIYKKISQTYLLSASSKNIDLTKYVIFFINLVNGEKFSSLKDITFGEMYYKIEEKDDSIKKDDVLLAIKNIQESSLNFTSSKHKILIIKNIEKGTAQSLNALLKFLEQSPPNLITIMTCNKRNSVLKTIRSRALEININQLIFKSKNTTDKFLLFINSIYNDEEIDENLTNNKKNLDALIKLDKNLSTNLSNIFSFMYEIFTNKNWYILLNYLYIYFYEMFLLNKCFDIIPIYINKSNLLPISKTEKTLKIIKKYLNIFKNKTLNFKIQKSAFITSLEEIWQ